MATEGRTGNQSNPGLLIDTWYHGTNQVDSTNTGELGATDAGQTDTKKAEL